MSFRFVTFLAFSALLLASIYVDGEIIAAERRSKNVRGKQTTPSSKAKTTTQKGANKPGNGQTNSKDNHAATNDANGDDFLEKDYFYPVLRNIKKPRGMNGTGYTKKFGISGFGRNFSVYLQLFDDFVSPDLIVEYTDLDKDNASRKTTGGARIFKGCVYKGKALEKATGGNTTYQAIFNLCHGIRGGFLEGDMEYVIKPDTENTLNLGRRSSDQKKKQKNLHCVGRRKVPKGTPAHIAKNEKKILTSTPPDEPKNIVFEIEMALFVLQNAKGSPNMNEIASVVGMTARMLANPTLGANLKLVLTRIIYIKGKHGISFKNETEDISQFNDYLGRYTQTNSAVKWDVAALFTSEFSPKGDCLGIAYMDSVCTENSGLISKYYGLGSAMTFAHEIGHTLGAPHDYGHDADGGDICLKFKNKDRGVMGYELTPEETYRWSVCSKSYILTQLKDAKTRKCLLERSAKVDPTIKSQPDKKFTCPDFCTTTFGSSECHYDYSNCTMIFCKNGGTTDTMDGLYCSGKKLTPKPSGYECLQGKCVKV